jgi:hypothetical protein
MLKDQMNHHNLEHITTYITYIYITMEEQSVRRAGIGQ